MIVPLQSNKVLELRNEDLSSRSRTKEVKTRKTSLPLNDTISPYQFGESDDDKPRLNEGDLIRDAERELRPLQNQVVMNSNRSSSSRQLDRPFCRFFSLRSGCLYGILCPFKHLTEEGECLRCGEVLRLADVDSHCSTRRPCALRRRNSAQSSRRLDTNLQRSRERTSSPSPNSNASDVESTSPLEFNNHPLLRESELLTTEGSQTIETTQISSSSSSSSSIPLSSRRITQPSISSSIPLATRRRPQTSSSRENNNTWRNQSNLQFSNSWKNNVVAVSMPTSQASKLKSLWKGHNVCRFHLKGCCMYIQNCRHLHIVDSQCVLCELPITKEALDKHLCSCSEYRLLKAEIKKVKEAECPICLNSFSEIPPYNERRRSRNAKVSKFDRFALLPDCGHTFCLRCIVSWRSEQRGDYGEHQQGRYRCPICRNETRLVVPCNRILEGEERCLREKEIFTYLRQCRFYRKGNCRYGASCSFAHLDAEGRPASLSELQRWQQLLQPPSLFGGFEVLAEMMNSPLMSSFETMVRGLGLEDMFDLAANGTLEVSDDGDGDDDQMSNGSNMASSDDDSNNSSDVSDINLDLYPFDSPTFRPSPIVHPRSRYSIRSPSRGTSRSNNNNTNNNVHLNSRNNNNIGRENRTMVPNNLSTTYNNNVRSTNTTGRTTGVMSQHGHGLRGTRSRGDLRNPRNRRGHQTSTNYWLRSHL